jgi:hypothetical protein
VDPKIRVGLEFMTSRLRIQSYWVNDFLSYLPKMVSSKPSLRESILARKRCLRLLGNSVIHIFWKGLMATKNFFFRYGSLSINYGAHIRFWEDK